MATDDENRRFPHTSLLKANQKAGLLNIMVATIFATTLALVPAAKADESSAKIDQSVTTGSVRTAPEVFRDVKSKQLLQALLKAQTQKEGSLLERKLIRHWRVAPNAEARALFNAGAHASRRKDYNSAIVLFNMLEEKAPQWSEVYSERAFFKYQLKQNEQALEDVNKALALQPSHFMALSGKFYILKSMGRTDEAHEALEIAVAIHPFLKTRRLLGKNRYGLTQL